MADDVAVSNQVLINRRDGTPAEITFITSPEVPNPAAPLSPTAAASIGEVQDLIAESSAGFIRSMNPLSFLLPFLDNTSAETSMLTAAFPMPRISHEAVFRVVASGVMRNNSGAPATLTWRLRNTTDALVVVSVPLTLANDTGTRPWRFEVVGEGNVFLADSIGSVGHLLIGAGGVDPLQQAMGQAGIGIGSDPQNWDLTVQSSVANASIEVTVYSAQVLYALAGA